MPFPPVGPGDGDFDGREIQFSPRKRWEEEQEAVTNNSSGAMSSIAEDDEYLDEADGLCFSSSSDFADNNSIRSFLSVLDRRRPIAQHFSQSQCSGQERIILVREQQRSSLFSPAPFPRARLAGKSKQQSNTIHRFCGALLGSDLKPTPLELAFHRKHSNFYHIQKNKEADFHSYIDFLEAEQQRGDFGIPGDQSDAEVLDSDGFMMSVSLQQRQREQRYQLSILRRSDSASSLSSTASFLSLPSDGASNFARCDSCHSDSNDENIDTSNLTIARKSSSPAGIILSSPYQLRNEQLGALWVAVPAANESGGEVWENVDEGLTEKIRSWEDDDRASTFTACEEDLEDEQDRFPTGVTSKGDVRVVKSSHRWGRCMKVVKRMFGCKR